MNEYLLKKYENIIKKFSQEMQKMSSENDIREFFSKKDNSGRTTAQKIYEAFEKRADIDIEIFNHAKSEREIVNRKLDIINTFSSDFFDLADSKYDLNNIFQEEVQRHKKEKQQEIKKQALQNNIELYHFSSISPENLEEGVLKAKRERPNLALEEVFTGVCAFPSNVGTYALKSEGIKGSFHKDDYVILYESPPKDDKEIIGYGYKVDINDFIPTVSNSGMYAKEWISTESQVEVKEIMPVNMQHLREKGLQIFYADEDKQADIQSELKDVSGTENRIEKLKELAQNDVIIDYNKMIIERENKQKNQEDAQQNEAKSHFSNPKNQKQATKVVEKMGRAPTPEELARFKMVVNAGKGM